MTDWVLNLILFAAALLGLAYLWSYLWRQLNAPIVQPKPRATIYDLRARAVRKSATVTKWPSDRGAA
jgi:hypothetical protein